MSCEGEKRGRGGKVVEGGGGVVGAGEEVGEVVRGELGDVHGSGRGGGRQKMSCCCPREDEKGGQKLKKKGGGGREGKSSSLLVVLDLLEDLSRVEVKHLK